MRALVIALCFGAPVWSASADPVADALTRQFSACWNVGAASTDTLRSSVEVVATMRLDGSVEAVDMVSSTGPSDTATRGAFEIAGRAMLRCAKNANLPPDAYDQWRKVNVKFDYSTMQVSVGFAGGEVPPADNIVASSDIPQVLISDCQLQRRGIGRQPEADLSCAITNSGTSALRFVRFRYTTRDDGREIGWEEGAMGHTAPPGGIEPGERLFLPVAYLRNLSRSNPDKLIVEIRVTGASGADGTEIEAER